MNDDDHRVPEAEGPVRAALNAGDAARAVVEALRVHGPEVFGFLVGVLDDGECARVVYAGTSAVMAEKLATFQWRCSLRTWMYAMARRELARRRGSPTRREASFMPSATIPDPTTTISRRPTGLRAAIATLRSGLLEEDRELLVLRIDRGLGWADLAITALGEDASPLDLARESDRMRRRLAHIREEIARAAAEHQLLAPRV
jgi:RNA polymerase sigma-70 factor (ECF subfamily)